MQKRKCSSFCAVSPFVECRCPQYKSLNPDCQPNNLTFRPSAPIFVEKHAIPFRTVRNFRALYTNAAHISPRFSAKKMQHRQVSMRALHIFSLRARFLNIRA